MSDTAGYRYRPNDPAVVKEAMVSYWEEDRRVEDRRARITIEHNQTCCCRFTYFECFKTNAQPSKSYMISSRLYSIRCQSQAPPSSLASVDGGEKRGGFPLVEKSAQNWFLSCSRPAVMAKAYNTKWGCNISWACHLRYLREDLNTAKHSIRPNSDAQNPSKSASQSAGILAK